MKWIACVGCLILCWFGSPLMGAVPESGTVLCTVMVSEPCNVTLGANVLWGGAALLGGSLSETNLWVQLSILAVPFCWTSACPYQQCGDANCDGLVSAIDVQLLLNAWGGPYDPCVDFNRDGLVSAQDVMVLIISWGACPVY